MISPALTRYLTTWTRPGSSQPPLLLVGPPDITSHTAQFIAQTILGETKAVHPDLITYTSEDKYTIELIRSLEDKLSRRPLHGTHVIVLPMLEQLRTAASQALLKTLEEPPSSTRFILTTAFPRRLLPTILSRCTRFFVGNITSDSKLTTSLAVSSDDELTDEAIQTMHDFLNTQLRQHGPTPELRRGFQRFRDYYKIRALKGNEKLARQVLVASLREIR